jgi:ribosomal protein S18 acetylase RimI-like enzyme
MEEYMHIRKINKDELDTVRALALYIWPLTYATILSEDQLSYMLDNMYSKTALDKQASELRHQFLLVELNAKPVAFASYAATEKTGVYKLHKIYVRADQQGKGIGKSIINFVCEDITKNEASALELNVNRNNKAVSFYEKLGFEIIKEEDIDIGNGYFMDDYVMRKTFAQIGK